MCPPHPTHPTPCIDTPPYPWSCWGRRKHLPGTLTHSIHTFIPEALILAVPSMEIRDWETAVFQQHALLRDNVSVVINQLKWLKILTTGSVGAYYGSTLFPVMVRV